MFKIREEFRRDGLAAHPQLCGEHYKHLVETFSGARFNIGYPSISKGQKAKCLDIIEQCYGTEEMCVTGVASRESLDILISTLNDYTRFTSANIWIPSSERLSKRLLGCDLESIKIQLKELIAYWSSQLSSVPIDLALVDSISDEVGWIENSTNIASFALQIGFRSVILCNSLGTNFDPEKVIEITSKVKQFGECELHIHADSFEENKVRELALACKVDFVGTSLARASERGTLPDSISFHSQPNLDSLDDFLKSYERDFGNIYSRVSSIFCKEKISSGAQYLLQDSPSKNLLFSICSDRRIVEKMINIRLSSHQLSKLKDILFSINSMNYYMNDAELLRAYERFKALL
ncbi:hypothetical protein J1N51_03445 [Psychrosphaera ytuae]|uniref:Pyruvate carboxyltransferase domain-containing protein n=1 Tax=Psychrosphaera ytuae TaxID=2820710 RepID=A0A975DDV3_9GAMM|nr:hypothetical protein [Psychrosphaera ytuae]QTH64541.1 hypothetical protein J1N51_03445 [Psychrosphaera ytuae]